RHEGSLLGSGDNQPWAYSAFDCRSFRLVDRRTRRGVKGEPPVVLLRQIKVKAIFFRIWSTFIRSVLLAPFSQVSLSTLPAQPWRRLLSARLIFPRQSRWKALLFWRPLYTTRFDNPWCKNPSP